MFVIKKCKAPVMCSNRPMISNRLLVTLILGTCVLMSWGAPIADGSRKEPNKPITTVSRVVNGIPVADDSEYPFVVDLSARPVAISSSRFCTATLIRPNILLTAAHCVLNDGYPKHVYATVGRIELNDHHKANEKKKTFQTIASIVHPRYSGVGSPNDIAVMLLNESSKAAPVSLSKVTPKIDSKAWVVGYGIKDIGTVEEAGQHVELMSRRLQKTAVRIKKKSFCDVPGTEMKTPDGMLCTAGVKKESSACKGDSGGGLFIHPAEKHTTDTKNKPKETIQVGVVSYGDAKCMSEDSGVFTDVASGRDWINMAASKLDKAFSILRLNMDGEASVSTLHSGGQASEDKMPFATRMTTTEYGGMYQDTTFYSIHTDFKKEKHVSASLCDKSREPNANLLMISSVESKVAEDTNSTLCPSGKLSTLSFRSSKGTYVIGVRSSSKVPLKLEVASSAHA
ncbi:unnamed protein product [Chondrus crispus]|uniref:Peptidase S1 domain-containing protein n=1 Tax=Chondrus crispus TaxID=2769 RepID=R7QCW5_CHOCR|nr:unnamed protein product [Chondrus crispus]CDF35608.1 unnamed protein product [Chondrus crispus]|eukprot:XP_005715427.1 unnamed protein product [Chondrus crispus]